MFKKILWNLTNWSEISVEQFHNAAATAADVQWQLENKTTWIFFTLWRFFDGKNVQQGAQSKVDQCFSTGGFNFTLNITGSSFWGIPDIYFSVLWGMQNCVWLCLMVRQLPCVENRCFHVQRFFQKVFELRLTQKRIPYSCRFSREYNNNENNTVNFLSYTETNCVKVK